MADFLSLLPESWDAEIAKAKTDVREIAADIAAVSARMREMGGKMEAATTFRESANAAKDLSAAEKELAAAADALTKKQEKLKFLQSEQARQIAELDAQIRKQTQANKANADSVTSAEGSLNKMRAQLRQAQQAYDQMSQAQREGTEAGKQAKAEVDRLTVSVKALEEGTGRYGRNVGNYSGAVKTLEGALEDVRRRMAAYGQQANANQDVVAALAREEGLLAKLVETQVNGFANATQELRKNEAALQQLAAAGMQSTEFYQQLLKDTAELKDNVGDLKNEIKNLASDTSTIDGLIEGAQLLAGAYAIGAGTAEALGVSQDTLEESQKKFQAVMEILNGLQAIQNALQKDSSFMLLINTARTKAAAGWIAIKNFVLNGSIGATRGATTATAANTTATTAQTTATVATTTATTAATVAMRVLRTVLISTGIGLIIVLFTALAASAAEYGESAKMAARDTDDLSDAMDNLKESQGNLNSALSNSSRVNLARMKAEGADKKKLFDQEQVDMDASIKHQMEYIEKQKALRDDAKKNAEAGADDDDVDKEEFQKRFDLWQKFEKDVQEGYSELGRMQADKQVAAYDFQSDLNDQAREKAKKDLEKRKKDAEDHDKKMQDIAKRNRKAQADLLILESEDRAAAYKRAADNEELSAGERLTASASFYNEKRSQIIATANFEAGQEKKTADEIKLIKAKEASELTKLDEDRKISSVAILKAELEERKKAFDDYLDHVNDANDTQEVEELGALVGQLQSGEITLQQYGDRRLAQQAHYARLRLQTVADDLQEEINLEEAAGQDTTGLQKQLNGVKAQLYDDDVENFKKAKEDKEKIEKAWFDAWVDVGKAAVSIVNSFTDAAHERRMKQYEDEQEKLTKAKDAEIRAIQASGATELEVRQKTAEAEARYAAKSEEIEARKRAEAARRARFEKNLSIAQIIADTSLAVIRALSDKSVPYPARLAFAVSAGAVGAAQLAAAIAAPVPSYAEGTDDHPGGKALIGEAGRPEVVKEPGGKTYVVDKPTLADLPRHTIVYPSIEDYAMEVMASNMIMLGLTAPHHDERLAAAVRQGNAEMIRMIGGELRQVKKAIQQQPPIHIHTQSPAWNQYVHNAFN